MNVDDAIEQLNKIREIGQQESYLRMECKDKISIFYQKGKQRMEENSLEKKIKKQLEYIRDQVTRFLRSFQSTYFKPTSFTPYIQAINRIFDLNNSYGEDYYEFIEKKNLDFILGNNRLLMKDIIGKLKTLSASSQSSDIPPQKIKQAYPESICKLCNLHIQSQTIQVAKNKVDNNGLNELKRMLKKIQIETNQALFTEQEDHYFFQQLHKALNGKLQVLSITDNHLEKYLDDMTKNLQEINYLQNLKDTTFPLPTNVNWQAKIKNEIYYVLLNTFKGKVPPWVHNTFDKVAKLNQKLIRQLRQTNQTQTDPYVQQQVLQLKKQIQRRNQDQKMKRVINQDYLKTIQEKQDKIKTMEIQISALKQTLFSKDITSNKAHILNHKDPKNRRKSSLSNHKDLQEPRRSKFMQQNLSSSFNQTNYAQINPNQTQQIQPGQNGQYFGTELRKDQSMTEHVGSSLLTNHTIKKRKNKKFTMDVNLNPKSRSIEKSNSFLPLITKPSTNHIQIPQVNLKKPQNITGYDKKNNKALDRQQAISQHSESQINDLNISRSIIEVDQCSESNIKGSELNLTQKISDQQTRIRIKKYRQTITDVSGMLQNKIKNSQALKKLKKTSLLCLNSKWNPMLNSVSRFSHAQSNQSFSSKMVSVQKILTDYMTQTQNVQISQKKRFSSQQKKDQMAIDSNRSKLKEMTRMQGICVQIQTQETKQSLLQKLQQTNIQQERLVQILVKLLSKYQNSKNKYKQKQNIDEKETRSRVPAKSMFMEQSNLTYRDPSPHKNTLIIMPKVQQTNLSSTRNHMPLQTCLFTKKDFSLFLNEQNSFKYQSNLKQKYHKSPYLELTQSQTHSLTSLYNVVQLIKHKSLHQYNNILSFVKYPYQTVVNNFSILNIVKQMSLESWLWYMSRIKHCHQKCLDKADDKKMICAHVQKFAEKIENILVCATHETLEGQEVLVNRQDRASKEKSPKRSNLSPKKIEQLR